MDHNRIKHARILVVDDQPSNVLVLERLLRLKGWQQVDTLTDARLVADQVREKQPDLVLLDLWMRHLNGLEVLDSLQPVLQREFLPVIVLTADTGLEPRQKALARGARDFLNKPFDSVEVILRIRNLLEARFMYLDLRERNDELDRKVRERTRELEETQREVLERLALAAEYRDDETGDHARRVGSLARQLALAVGIDRTEADLIGLAAPLHDLGKIGIPDAVLLKRDRLTREEMAVMRRHTAIGAGLLAGSRFPLMRLAQQIARSHHESWDGSGYEGLKGREIPIASRIVAVADAFDALTHDRPYRRATSEQAALEEIKREAGRQFDPEVVSALERIVGSEEHQRQCA